MTDLGTAKVHVGADTSDLDRGLGRANKGLGSFAKKIPVIAGLVVGLAGAAGFGALVKSSFNVQDALAKSGDTLGIVNERMAGLKLASERAGLSQAKVEKSITKTSQRVSEAAQGTGEAVGALNDLNLSAKELNSLSPDERFARINTALKDVANSGDKARIAGDIFGRNSVDMMRLTGEAIDEATTRAKAYGTALSRTDAAKIEDANDAFGEAKEAMSGIATTFAVKLAPTIRAVSQGFADMVLEADGFKGAVETGSNIAKFSIGLLADSIWGLKLVFKGVQLAATGAVSLIAQGIAGVINIIEDKVNTVIGAVNTAIRGMNRMPFTNISELAEASFGDNGVAGFADHMKDRVAQANAELVQLAVGDKPSDKIRKLFQDADEAATKSAEITAQSGAKKVQTIQAVDTAATEAAIAERERMVTELEGLNEHLQTKAERETGAFQKRLAIAADAREKGMISDQRYNAIALKLSKEHADSLYKIEAKAAADTAKLEEVSNRDKLQRVSSTFGNMSGLMRSESKAMFQVGKAFAIADAGVQASMAAMRGFAAMAPFGPIAQGAAVAAAAAMGAHTISKIAGQSFGSGSANPSVPKTPSGNAVQVDPVRRSRESEEELEQARAGGGNSTGGDRTVVIKGSFYTAQDIRNLIEAFNEEVPLDQRWKVTG